MRTEKQNEDFGQNRKQQNRKRILAEVGKESRLAEKSEASQSGRLKEKRADLSENRGDSRSKKNGGSKKPKQKQRLKFAYEETGAFEITIAQFFSDDESRLDLTKEQKEILEIWDGLDEKEREIFMTFIRSLKK